MPVEPVPAAAPDDTDGTGLDEKGVALCLSGGGYRAMLFHVGTLWRLNELGILQWLTRVSSVSGGSITAGVLALAWPRLAFSPGGAAASFAALIVDPLRRLAGKTLDKPSIFGGVLLPGTVADRVAKGYAKHLFGDATLQDLPDDPSPRFVVNATSLQTGSLWRFSRRRMGDYRVGLVRNPTLSLARAVAASSAFPPVLSPMVVDLSAFNVEPATGADVHRDPYTKRAVLTDGGVYDNLGLETVWKRCRTVLVSDGGGHAEPEPSPAHLWPQQSVRVLNVIDRQVRSLRKRHLVESYKLAKSEPMSALARRGCYWGIWTPIEEYPVADPLVAPGDRTAAIAAIPTRLAALSDADQERLINWGYAACDASVRSFFPPPGGGDMPRFPYPRGVS